MSRVPTHKTFLVLLLAAISFTFVAMIRQFLVTILLAAIFAGLAWPLHARLTRWFGGRRVLAALCTLGAFLVLVVGPTLTVLGIVAREAFQVSEAVIPWVQRQVQDKDALFARLDGIEWIAGLKPYWTQILEKLGQVVARGGQFLFERLSDTTRGTVSFLFKFGIFLYTMFFFLLDGRALLRRILYYLPLPDDDERRMVDKFLSVSRATLKGTVVIGLLQGGLTGLAFALVGIEGAVFWGTLAVVLSIIPGVGAALIWVPGVLYLFATGQTGSTVFVLLFCGGLVSTLDNFLRPRLVGRDVQMHDLLILFGTLGGIVLFGVAGFILGPIIAALFVTVWEIYGIAFKENLPDVAWLGASSGEAPAGGEPASPRDGERNTKTTRSAPAGDSSSDGSDAPRAPRVAADAAPEAPPEATSPPKKPG